jgi:hypothetical protein
MERLNYKEIVHIQSLLFRNALGKIVLQTF